MPRGSHHVLTGILWEGHLLPILRVDDGGEWRLDVSGQHRQLLGRRVRVEGTRTDFDILWVDNIIEAPAQ